MTLDLRSQGACWDWTMASDAEITGPMALTLWVEAHDADDVDLFVGLHHDFCRKGVMDRA